MPIATVVDPGLQAAEAVRRIGSLATLPEITARIIETVENPRSSAAQLHKIVSNDPALATRILKVVNSSFYGLPGQIGSIERAIVLLGLSAVKNIAVAASLGQLLRGVRLSEKHPAEELWLHSVAVAVTARQLARTLHLPIADEAFLAGMIHDIGILVSLHVWPRQLAQVCNQVELTGAHFCDVEMQLMGTDHQHLGLALARQWRFPKPCQQAAGFHHRPDELSNDDNALVRIVHAADTLVAHAKLGFSLTAQHQSPESLGLDLEPDALRHLQLQLPALVAEASPLGA